MNPLESPVEPLFDEALQQPTPELRAAFLDRVCQGKPELRSRLEELLAAHAEVDSFLSEPASGASRPTLKLSVPVEEKPGTVIGRYKLLQRIGEGGCGVVYMAEQEQPVKRRVALKIIKLGMDTKQVVARFEAERQALAMMDHPHIAKVLDAGATETGRPFFVMELVRGIKITEYCDQNKLSTDDRLNLFTPVCQAIQHAHQKGIIHRDIKPSNILVTLHDGVPVPKVIDFGIAKATQGRLTDQTLFTAFEQFIGTPAYMSPEQAEMSGLDIDTRTDVYSLGVLLYELLTSRTPFDSRELLQAGLDALRRTIREKEPQRPSTRLSTMEADLLANTADHRHTDAPKLIHLIRGDLDWIVMKSLEKDRTRRYETANGLAMDVQRYLKNEPIVARSPSKLYRFQKAVRRNKPVVFTVCLIALALTVGAVLSLIQAARATRAEIAARKDRAAADHARMLAEATTAFLTEDLLYQADPDENPWEKRITLEEVINNAARNLDQNPMSAQDWEMEAIKRIALGSTYLRLGKWMEGKHHLERAVALRRNGLGTQNRETLLTQKQLCEVMSLLNNFSAESEQLSRETMEGLKRLAASPNGKTDTNMLRAALDAESVHIWVLANRGQLDKAIQLKRENIAAYDRTFGSDAQDTLNELNNLTLLFCLKGDYAESERIARETLKSYQRLGRTGGYDDFMTINNLALYRLLQGDAKGAESIFSEVLPRCAQAQGPEKPVTLLAQHRLARTLDNAGKLSAAEALGKRVLEVRRRVLPAGSGNTAYSMLLLGRIQVKLENPQEAKPLLEEARAIFRDHYQFRPDLIAQAENWLGAILLAQKQLDAAGEIMLKGADQFLARTAELSPNERREGVSHVIQLFQALEKPDKAADWERRLNVFLNSLAAADTAISAPSGSASHPAK